MIQLQGKGVSRGVAKGQLYFYRRERIVADRTEGASADAERARYHRAQALSAAQLTELAEQCREVNAQAAILFDTHAMLVEDEDFEECILKAIETGRSAEYAVQQAGERFAGMFAAMEDAYMQARAADIRDVAERMISNLTGNGERKIEIDGPVILAADDLAPSETVRLDKKRILGFLTREGSGNSHTAILARMMGIPAVCSIGDGLKDEYSGRMVCMDGETGYVALDPDEETLSVFEEKRRGQQEVSLLMENMIGQDDVTSDGRKIDICCNIGSVEDVNAVLANDGRGIGLFRSEFLYLAAQDFPDEETQFQAYSTVAAAMKGKRVVIRTLDIGADKQADYFRMKKEENPALGMRAIRLCLKRPEIFRTQLRALYRASAYGKIAIMFPMITSVWEVRECRRICRMVMDELDREGIEYNRDTEIGIMIETPASVLAADALAGEADFFSVGTNDLTQYILAIDRQRDGLEDFYDPHHPAVLRALKMAADAAHDAGIWIGICGELAADHELLPAFLCMGIDELSVSPSDVLPLRMQIRKSSAGSCSLEMREG